MSVSLPLRWGLVSVIMLPATLETLVPFTETVKKEAKQRANFRCVACQTHWGSGE